MEVLIREATNTAVGIDFSVGREREGFCQGLLLHS